jgi:heme/copper-type cytochrome/quinol oxidase subunit 2
VLVAWVNAAAMAWAGEPVILQPGADGVQRTTITLDSYSYSPDHIVVQAGRPVELTLASVTTITPHNFIIKELAVEQDVGAGKTVTFRFTSMQPGIYLFYCDKKLLFLPSHREKGMEGRLEVR